jgi:hypothetical protein
MEPISAILGIVDACRLTRKDDVVQNRKKSELLLDAPEAVERALKENQVPTAYNETLSKLKATVEDAHALLQKQCKRNRVYHFLHRGAVRQDFEGINSALQLHMTDLNISVVVLSEVSAEMGDANAQDDAAEMPDGLKQLIGKASGGVDFSDFFIGTPRRPLLDSSETDFLIVGRRTMVLALPAESGPAESDPHDLIQHEDALDAIGEEFSVIATVAEKGIQALLEIANFLS